MTKICVACPRSFPLASKNKLCGRCRYQKWRQKPCTQCEKPCVGTKGLCITCSNKSRTRDLNPSWKGGMTRHQKGYVLEHSKGHPRATQSGHVLQHILVMEDVLQRPLLPGENVHHINGVKDDNRPENLELWAVNQPPGQRVSDLISWAKELLRRYEPDTLMAH